MTPPFSKILSNVPAMTPFVGPEAIERRLGHTFRLRLGANESAFGASPKVKAVLAAEAERVSWYCDPEHFDLREKLAGLLGVARENIVIGEGIDGLLGVGRDTIVIGEGIDGLLGLIVRAFADPGETIVTSAGAYPTFNYHVIGYGGRLEFVPYTPARQNDIDALVAAAARTGARLLYIANPDNPTGSFLGRAAVEHMIERLPARCLLVLDEAYAEFAPAHELPPIEPGDPRVIRLRTFSKAHGLAGMRVGYAVAAPEIVAAFDKIRLHFGVGRLSQVAAVAALDDPGFAAHVVRAVADGRRDYETLGRALNVATLTSLTNFVPFDFETGARAARMLTLLEERDVFVRRPGVAPLDRYVRVTIGTAEERAAFAKAFKDAAAEL